MQKHLAILSKVAINDIISGRKLYEVRLSVKKIPPFGQVHVGDLVYMKPPGEEIAGQFEVKKVLTYEGLGKEEFSLLKSKFQENLEFLNKHQNAHVATVIQIGNVEQFIASPLKIQKKDLRGWVVLKN